MLEANVSPNFLYELCIPRNEQLGGQLSNETYENILKALFLSVEDQTIHSSMENFLSVQTVADKTIADGVEALIGAYLKVRLSLCVYNSLSSDRLCISLAGDVSQPNVRHISCQELCACFMFCKSPLYRYLVPECIPLRC